MANVPVSPEPLPTVPAGGLRVGASELPAGASASASGDGSGVGFLVATGQPGLLADASARIATAAATIDDFADHVLGTAGVVGVVVDGVGSEFLPTALESCERAFSGGGGDVADGGG
jgi:hypothetical protein